MTRMNITLNLEISNREILDFGDLEREIFDVALQVGRQLMEQALKKLDDELLAGRDAARYRNKGFRQTCIKTKLGAIEYSRRVYVDKAAPESARCVHLLDEALHMEKVGLVSAEVCQVAAAAVCETTYRGAAELISETTGLEISAQGVWNLIQKALRTCLPPFRHSPKKNRSLWIPCRCIVRIRFPGGRAGVTNGRPV